MRRIHVLLAVLGVALALIPLRDQVRYAVLQMTSGRGEQKTAQERVQQYGGRARKRLAPSFRRAGVAYPPARVVLLGLKDTQTLDVYAAGKDGALRFIRAYPVLAASGALGPKLREGDCQVPEGIYGVEGLNPNSAFHLSLRVSYPNDFDRAMAKNDGRTNLGGDIMIHGGAASVGCLAVGDPAAEDLFILAADAGIRNVKVILSPTDFHVTPLRAALPREPAWVEQLYKKIERQVRALPQ